MSTELQKTTNLEGQQTLNVTGEDFNCFLLTLNSQERNNIKDCYSKIKDPLKQKAFETEILENKDEWWEINLAKILTKYSINNETRRSEDETRRSEDETRRSEDETRRVKKNTQENGKIEVQLIEKTKKLITEFYNIFGSREELDRKLGENGVDVDGLREKARVSVARTNPGLDENSPEFKSKVEVSFIANNRREISAVVPEELKSQFEAIYDKVTRSAEALEVPYVIINKHEEDKNSQIHIGGATISERQAVTLSIPEGTEITRRGGLITYEKDGYTVEINLEEQPPERYIKGEGLEIKVKNEDIKFESRYEFKVKRRKLEGEIRGVKEYLGANKSKVDMIKFGTKNTEQDYNKILESYRKGIYIEKGDNGEIKPINLPAPQNKEVAEQGLKELYEKIIKDRQEVKTYDTYEKLLEQKERELIDLKKAEQEAIYKFKKSIQERDKIAEGNLKYLVKTHLSVFGDNNIDRIIALFNKYRAINGDAGSRPVNIDEGFRESDKSVIINGMTKLLGGIKYFKNINEPIEFLEGKPVNNKFIMDKLVSTGVVKNDRTSVDFNKVEELLSSSSQTQKASEKPQAQQNPEGVQVK